MPHSALLGWSDEDRAKLVAYLIEDSLRCEMCGTAGWEWEEDPGAYTAMEQLCMGCYHKESESAAGEATKGSKMTLVPRLQAERISATAVHNPRR